MFLLEKHRPQNALFLGEPNYGMHPAISKKTMRISNRLNCEIRYNIEDGCTDYLIFEISISGVLRTLLAESQEQTPPTTHSFFLTSKLQQQGLN